MLATPALGGGSIVFVNHPLFYGFMGMFLRLITMMPGRGLPGD